MKYILLFALLLSAAKGCKDKAPPPTAYGEEKTLAVGEILHLAAGENQGFMFLSVERDSRCPKGVNCIQAGEATIVVEEISGGPKQVTVPAESRAKPSFMIKGAKIEVLSLDPYPTDGQRTPFADYTLRVKVLEPAPAY